MNMIDHYFNARKLYTDFLAPVCEKYQLTYMELTVVLFLANNPSYDTATEIVKYQHLTKSHVSLSIRSLHQKKLLTCEYRDKNRRTVHLTLTDLANPLVTDGQQAQKDYIESLTHGFSPEEKKALMHFVERINDNISNSFELQNER